MFRAERGSPSGAMMATSAPRNQRAAGYCLSLVFVEHPGKDRVLRELMADSGRLLASGCRLLSSLAE
jgi:hypothetical protein